MADVAVVVVCHEPYLGWLGEALRSVDRQRPAPAERVLMLDGCPPPAWVPNGWRCLTGCWGHPAGARNAGIDATTAPWLIFLDADNVMPQGYLAAAQRIAENAAPHVAIAYPDIQYTDPGLRPGRLWTMPVCDYWSLRQQNCVDTASVWRRAALEIAGGWTPGAYLEDYHLALAVTAAGWSAIRLGGPPIHMREHGVASRRTTERPRAGTLLHHLWLARSLGIVSLLAGREAVLERWTRFLLAAQLPPRTALYVVDNGDDPGFSRRVRNAAAHVAAERGLTHVDIAVAGRPYAPAAGEGYLAKGRHLHVAQLYARTIPRVAEDLVFTLEDDVEPPADAIRVLGEDIGYPARARIGVSGGAYESPTFADHVCAAPGQEGWTGSIAWRSLPSAPVEVGCVGGGSAMWANWALRECAAHVQWQATLGWDGVLCTALRRNGYRVRVHGGVRCVHHRHGRLPRAVDRAAGPSPAPRAAPPRRGSA